MSAKLQDHTGERGWVFDQPSRAWRPCVVTGPDQGNPDWPLCPVRLPDGSTRSVGPLVLRFIRPAGRDVRILPR